MITAWFQQVWVLLWKDLLIDLRRKENIIAMFFFALLTLLIFRFALGDDPNPRYRINRQALGTLAEMGVPQEARTALSRLRGRTFPSRAVFLQALRDLPEGTLSQSVRVRLLQLTERGTLRDSAAGLLWVTVLLAGVLGLSKSFTQEKEHGCMDGLLLTPVSRGVLYVGKMASNALFLVLILALLLPLFALFFQVRLGGVLGPLVVVLLGGILGFAALGTLLGGITSTLKGRELLLPILLYPLLVPIVVVSVHLTNVVLEGDPLLAQGNWLQLLAAFDGLFLVVSYLVFDYVMES